MLYYIPYLLAKETFLLRVFMINFLRFLNPLRGPSFSFNLKLNLLPRFCSANADCTAAWNAFRFSLIIFICKKKCGTVHQWRKPPILTPPLLYWVSQKHHVLKCTIFQHELVLFHFHFVLLYTAVTGHDVAHKLPQTLHSPLALVVLMYYQDFHLCILCIITNSTPTHLISQLFNLIGIPTC